MQRIQSLFTRYFLSAYLMVAIAAGMSFAPSPALAGSLDSAFGSLLGGTSVTTTTPGAYQSQVRNVYTLGGIRVRFNRSSVQLFSITPPSFSAGCGGIDAFLGGMSFISGAQFQQLLRNIGQAAIGYVVMLALKQLCPQCQAVLEALQKAAQMANKMSIDSCQAGEKLAKKAWSFFGGSTTSDSTAAQSKCGSASANRGDSEGFMDAVLSVADGICNGINDAMGYIDDFLADEPEKKDVYANVYGNITWRGLKAMGMVENYPWLAELLMSMVGTTINKKEGDGAQDKTQPGFYPPTTIEDGAAAINLFMCGLSHGQDMPPAGLEYCKDVQISGKLKLYSCGPDQKDLEDCLSMDVVDLQTWNARRGNALNIGFIELLNKTITDAVKNVQSNTALTPAQLALIQTAPLPLYRVINLAAVYPGAVQTLLDSNVLLLAYLYADGYFRFLIEEARKAGKRTDLDGTLIRELIKAQSRIRDGVETKLEYVDKMLARQQLFLAQTKRLEKVLQDTIWSRGLMNNQIWARSVVQ